MTSWDGQERRKSALTDEDRDFIHRKVEEAVNDAVKNHVCYMTQNEREAAKTWYGLLADIGDSDRQRGLRRVRDFFRFVEGMYNKKNVLSGLLFMGLCAAMIGAFLKIAGSGLWGFMKEMLR